MHETQMNRDHQVTRGEQERHPEPATEGPVAGFGACSASGCNCKAYAGSGDTCSNCGHNYQTHW